MPRKYTPVQFAPRIYAEWGELISDLSDSEKARIFEAIIKYPNIELDSGVWRFIKSQLEKDYQIFLSKCSENQKKARNYWEATKENQSITTATPGYTTDNKSITKENQGEPKHKQETETKTEIKEKITKKKIEYVKFLGEQRLIGFTEAQWERYQKHVTSPGVQVKAIDILEGYALNNAKKFKQYKDLAIILTRGWALDEAKKNPYVYPIDELRIKDFKRVGLL